MKLYTKFGDEGQTALCDGTRVFKDDQRVWAYGTVDELNAVLGWCRVEAVDSGCGVRGAGFGKAASAPQSAPRSTRPAQEELAEKLDLIQQELFVLGAQLAMPAGSQCLLSKGIGPEQVQQMETWIDQSTAAAEPLQHFVLPGGTELAARFHIARTVCRRAEREAISLHRAEPIAPDIIVYLNRLSDLLFAWSRQANAQANCPEAQWIAHHP